jgi:hypothetical protein
LKRTLIQQISIIWRILYPCIYLFALILLGWYAFKYNDQGQDFFIGVITDKLSVGYVAKSGIFLIFWCLLSWYAARLTLQLKPLHVPHDSMLALRLIVWIPRIIGVLPLFIVMDALSRAAKKIPNELGSSLYVNIALQLLGAAALMYFFMTRPRIARAMGIDFAPALERYSASAIPFDTLWASKATRIALRLILASTLLMITPFFFFLKAGYARMLQPATVLLCGFIFFTILASLFVMLVNFRKSPAFLFVAGYILAVSTCNNNNAIRTLDGPLPQREGIAENFSRWIDSRMETSDSVVHVYLVAAEGGGIRGANWTALVLKSLDEKMPGFMDRLYAISGVSGGGVGSAFYLAYRKDRLAGAFRDTAGASSNFNAMSSEDFLSDLTAAFIFHDNLQRILPFPVHELSRNRKLEDSWGWSYQEHMKSSTMDESFLKLWDHRNASRMPNIFLNGLLAETGQKAVVSNLALNNSIFKDDIDVITELGRDIPVKTAASLCARFPLISSGALVKSNGKSKGHILDGGYKENSGIETAWQLAIALAEPVRKAELQYGKPIQIHMLFIRNSNDGPTVNDADFQTQKLLPDLSTILPGFLNAWDRRTETYANITRQLFNEGALRSGYHFSSIRLDNRNRLLPLGWYLSDTAKKNIMAQVRDSVPVLIGKLSD